MNLNWAVLKWLMPGLFLLSFLSVPAAGSSLTTCHSTAIRTELVEFRHVSFIHAITFAKAIHLAGHAHDAGDDAIPAFSGLAARFYTLMAVMQVKNSETGGPFRLKRFIRLKIPSTVDSDVDFH